MSDQLNFGDGSWDQAKGTIFTTLQGLKSDMDGNGKPGLKDDMQSVRTDLSEIKAYGRASAFWGRVIAWSLGAAIALGSLYIAYFEAHHHVSEGKFSPPITENSGAGAHLSAPPAP